MQGRDFSEYEAYYKKKMEENADMPDALKDCPTDKPFYDTVALGCLMCTGSSPLFNL